MSSSSTTTSTSNALIFTPDEIKLIEEVKSKLSNSSTLSTKYPDLSTLLPQLNDFIQRSEVSDEVFHVRWLRAYNGNVDKTINGIIELMRWRQRMNLDQSNLSRFVELFPKLEEFLCFMGSDKEGCPCLCLSISNFVPGTLQPYELIEELVGFVLEVAFHELRLKSEGKLEKFVVVIDYKGWSLSCVDTKLDKSILGTCQNYFPERLKMATLMRAPWLFSTAWAVAKLFLDEKTTEKISFVYEGDMLSELRRNFADETILKKFGGQADRAQTLRQYLEERMANDSETLLDYYKKRPVRK